MANEALVEFLTVCKYQDIVLRYLVSWKKFSEEMGLCKSVDDRKAIESLDLIISILKQAMK